MENQINISNKNTQQIGKNSVNQSEYTSEKPKINYSLIGGMVLICFVIFGFGGYYIGKQSLKNSTELKKNQTDPSPTADESSRVSNWKTYENVQYGLRFEYPQNYIVSTNPDCIGLTNNQSGCLLSLGINPSISEYSPKANFLFLKGISSVNIPGQVSSISYDSQKKTWILNQAVPPEEVLSVWDHTESGQEIIKSSNGGSHGSSYYYIIPNYKDDEVAIFAIPQSFRLRCDNFFTDKTRETDCNNFYKSIIDKYNRGETTADTWLPDNYLNFIYSEAEDMIKSYKNTGTDIAKAIDILKTIPEIQNIEKSVIKAGRKPFYTPEGANGDIVRVSLRESFPDDPHTSRIDTFNVDITTGMITVEDVVSGGQISLEEWKKKVNQSWGF